MVIDKLAILENIKNECIDFIKRKHRKPQALALGKIEFEAVKQSNKGRQRINIIYKGETYNVLVKRA